MLSYRQRCSEQSDVRFERGFFAQLGSTEPSATKWYTFEIPMTLPGGGLCCHGVLPRAMKMAFEEQAAIEVLPGVDPESFQAYR